MGLVLKVHILLNLFPLVAGRGQHRWGDHADVEVRGEALWILRPTADEPKRLIRASGGMI